MLDYDRSHNQKKFMLLASQSKLMFHNENKYFIFLKIKGSSREQFNLQRQPDLLVTKHFMLMISKSGDKTHYKNILYDVVYIDHYGLYMMWLS